MFSRCFPAGWCLGQQLNGNSPVGYEEVSWLHQQVLLHAGKVRRGVMIVDDWGAGISPYSGHRDGTAGSLGNGSAEVPRGRCRPGRMNCESEAGELL